ncbi:histidinol-phosphate aminotransferase [Limimaricola soesokkakensis]|uniref:histidinol-phosphate transaminase n=1 Tax=Limimaricola soesokkakensis TaxID=1343159 RepID=A0A1X6Y9Q0_9RHOB|nr:pyridoxal phosphate-dependent aminotransferase [Limimaricola soesokkakensis]PSK87179.1 histidinol-phosphate aminotransferase [Limimaricola soesokkakensis]SLN15059.1 Histidinol-phosphate aminotransferase [Limimaricola soesokkakensis]
MTDPRLTPLAASLPDSVPFVGPETQERRMGRSFAARLGANENAFGPAPAAIAAMQKAAEEVWMYGDPEAHELRQAIAAHHGVDPAHIRVGEGIDGLLGLLVRLTVGPGDWVVTSEGGYPTFDFHVTGFGGRIEQVPYDGDRVDTKGLVERAGWTGAKLVYIANPDNPMGGLHDAATIREMIEALPADALLVLDEAYVEFAPEAERPEIDPADDRVIRFRTFSKAHGLAGARVGYAIGPAPLIAAFDRVRNHFGLSRISQEGALAALSAREHLDHVLTEVAAARARIAAIAHDNGLMPLPSATNFVAVDCGGDGAFARRVMEGLAARGVFVRMPGVAPLNRCIRVTAGREADLDAFAKALPQALEGARIAP